MNNIRNIVLFSIVGLARSQVGSRLDCRTETLNTCIKLADPLLEDPRYVFPAASEDVDHVCNVLFPKTWSEFVTCIKQYTSDCLTANQRSDFNRAVGDSINSVHKMCTNDAYKQDYLQHAECIKEKSTTEVYCGSHYSRLVDMVKGVTPSTQRELCCSHRAFKDCVLHETRACGGGGQMSAHDFARAMLDKSLGFLLKQCQDYVPSRADCPGYDIPLEKTPRQIDSGLDSDNYYPSGERRPAQDPPRRPDDGWTNLNPNAPVDRDPSPPERREEEELMPLDLDNGDLDLEPLEPVTEATNFNPVRSDINGPPRPRLEDDGDWLSAGSQRKPWLPANFDQDIRPFDDIFGNGLESTFADARTGSGLSMAGNLMLVTIASALLLLRA